MLSSLVILLRNVLGPAAPSVAWPTHAKRLDVTNDILSGELTLVSRLRDGDDVLCVYGDIVPRDGEVVNGAAIVKDARDVMLASHRRLTVGASISAGTMILTNYVVVRLGAGPLSRRPGSSAPKKPTRGLVQQVLIRAGKYSARR